MTTRIPKPGEPIADRQGRITPSWRDYFRRLAGPDSLDAVWQAIEELRIAPGEELEYRGAVSILVSNVDGVVTVSLQGDADSPGGRYYYGTNASGIKGWWPVAEAVTGGGSLASAVDYGPYHFQGELDTPDELPYPVVVDDAYLINGDLWVGVDDGEPDDPGWDNLGPAPATAVLMLDNDVAIPDPSSYYGTDRSGSRGWHALPTSGVLPVVTGEIDNGQPVFVYADDGSLIYTEIA